MKNKIERERYYSIKFPKFTCCVMAIANYSWYFQIHHFHYTKIGESKYRRNIHWTDLAMVFQICNQSSKSIRLNYSDFFFFWFKVSNQFSSHCLYLQNKKNAECIDVACVLYV